MHETLPAQFGVLSCEVRPVTPRIVMEGEAARIVLPGEPG